MITSKLLKSSLIYTVVGSLPLAAGFILLPFYTNYLKGVGMYGVFSLYVNFSLLVQIVVNFSLDSSIGIHYFEFKDKKEVLKKYVGTIVSVLLILSAIFVLLSLLFGDVLVQTIFKDNLIVFFPFGLLSILTAIFNSLFKTYSNLLINQQRTYRFLWINVLFFVSSIVLTIAGFYLFPYQLDGPIWGKLLASALLFSLCLFFFYKEYGISLHREFLKETFVFCLPLLTYSLIMWVSNYGDRYLVTLLMSDYDVGIYDFSIKMTLIIDVVLMALTNAVNPMVYRIWSDKKINHSTEEVNSHLHFYTLVQLILISVTLVIIPLIVPLFVSNEDYYKSFQYLPLLVLGFLFSGMSNMFTMPLLYFRKTKVLPKIYLISSLIQLTTAYFLITNFQVLGVVISLVVVKPIQVYFLYLESKKTFDFKFNPVKMVVLPLSYGFIILFLYFIVGDPITRQMKDVIQLLICLLFIFLAYRTEIKQKLAKR
jgi:O-antigen/teichoic acid export membrane protein